MFFSNTCTCTCIAVSTHTTTALIRRFPGFTVAYGGGKRAEMKFQPSKICQQFMNKQFDEVSLIALLLLS